MVVAPPFQLGLLGWLYKKIKGAALIYHIHDLQIDAALELGMIKLKYMAGLMFRLERFILRKADFVSSISEGMIRKIKAKYERPVILFPNWANTSLHYPIVNKDLLKTQFNFTPADKIILYSGAIGEKQGLELILHSAHIINRPGIKFVICGSGPYKEKLHLLMKKMNVKNVLFVDLQPKELFNEFLNAADIHLILQKATANDLVMPSKLANILAIGGVAIISAPKESILYNLISKNSIGLVVEPDNQSALIETINFALDRVNVKIQENARTYAENNFTLKIVLQEFIKKILPQVKEDFSFGVKNNKEIKLNEPV